MKITIGIDVGAVSLKVAAAGDAEAATALWALGDSFDYLEESPPDLPLVLPHYRRLNINVPSAQNEKLGTLSFRAA
ncbi:MAG: hypothetical protein HY278_00055 [candidate division NC10 bacterium]|nr:hypothetical protein [candidate division NC10 bacterium]